MQRNDSAAPSVVLNDFDTEDNLLGACMSKPNAWSRAAGLLSQEDFGRAENRVLWAALCELGAVNHPTDPLSLTRLLDAKDCTRRAGGQARIFNLALDNVIVDVEHHARRLAELGRRRRVIDLCDRLREAAPYASADELAGLLDQGLNDHHGADGQALGFARIVDAGIKASATAREMAARGGPLGVSTTLRGLDHLLGGIYGPNLFVIAGRPGLGKTALATQIAVNAARGGHGGLFVSIEMSVAQLAQRAAASITRVNLSAITRGREGSAEAMQALGGLGEIPLWVDDATTNLDAIVARISAMHRNNGIEWAVVDHIGLVQTREFRSRNEQIGHISWTLKQTAKRLGIPIIALSQLSRRSEQETRRPRADDLRESGNIEQDADVILMVYSHPDDRDQTPRPIEIGIVKNRLGPSLWMDDPLIFDGRFQFFGDAL